MNTAYKGFDQDLKCRGFQYEVGKEYVHDGDVDLCESGFHACPSPLDAFGYYPPADNRFCKVEQSGVVKGDGDKIASSKIKVVAEIGITGLVDAHVKWVMNRIKGAEKESNTGDQSAATNTGYRSAATSTGYQSAATSTGYRSAAGVEGSESVAIAAGRSSKAKASKGSWIVVAERDEEGAILCILTAQAGEEIKPDTYYRVEGGEFVEATA